MNLQTCTCDGGNSPGEKREIKTSLSHHQQSTVNIVCYRSFKCRAKKTCFELLETHLHEPVYGLKLTNSES